MEIYFEPIGPTRPGDRVYVIPISCWQPREGTGIPADTQMYPPGCPDAEFCRGNRCCNWGCKDDGEE